MTAQHSHQAIERARQWLLTLASNTPGDPYMQDQLRKIAEMLVAPTRTDWNDWDRRHSFEEWS